MTSVALEIFVKVPTSGEIMTVVIATTVMIAMTAAFVRLISKEMTKEEQTLPCRGVVDQREQRLGPTVERHSRRNHPKIPKRQHPTRSETATGTRLMFWMKTNL